MIFLIKGRLRMYVPYSLEIPECLNIPDQYFVMLSSLFLVYFTIRDYIVSPSDPAPYFGTQIARVWQLFLLIYLIKKDNKIETLPV